MLGKKSILMVDRDDLRRKTRITLLEAQGAEVTARDNCSTSASLDSEGTFDLLIVAVNGENRDEAAGYVDYVHSSNPKLPILLLRDRGVSLSRDISGRVLEAGDPPRLLLEVGEMLESIIPDAAMRISTRLLKSSQRPRQPDRPNQTGDD